MATVVPASPNDHNTIPTVAYTLPQLAGYFLKLGTIGFGGPPALISYAHRDLVADRRWIADEDYREGLALAQLAPGPLAAQLAIYLGYVQYGVWGTTVTGLTFVLPSFLMVLALGWAYVRFGGLPWMQALFYGIGAAVIGMVAVGTYKLSHKTIKPGDTLGWVLFGVSAVVMALTETELVWLVLLAGVIYWFVEAPPTFLRADAGGILIPFWLEWLPATDLVL